MPEPTETETETETETDLQSLLQPYLDAQVDAAFEVARALHAEGIACQASFAYVARGEPTPVEVRRQHMQTLVATRDAMHQFTAAYEDANGAVEDLYRALGAPR